MVVTGLGITSQGLDSLFLTNLFSQGLSGSLSRSGVLWGSQDEAVLIQSAFLDDHSRVGTGLRSSVQASTNPLRDN